MLTLTCAALALLLATNGHPGAPIDQRSRTGSSERSSRIPSDEADRLRAAIQDLTYQLRLLRDEIAASETMARSRFEINAKRMELVTKEIERLTAEREKLRERLRDAQARSDDATYRMQNIQAEVSRAGDINRDQSRARISTSLERIIDQAQTEIREIQTDLFEVESALESNELLLRTLKRRLKIDDSQIGVEEPEPVAPPPSERVDTEPPSTDQP